MSKIYLHIGNGGLTAEIVYGGWNGKEPYLKLSNSHVDVVSEFTFPIGNVTFIEELMNLLEEPRNKLLEKGKIAYSSYLDGKTKKKK